MTEYIDPDLHEKIGIAELELVNAYYKDMYRHLSFLAMTRSSIDSEAGKMALDGALMKIMDESYETVKTDQEIHDFDAMMQRLREHGVCLVAPYKDENGQEKTILDVPHPGKMRTKFLNILAHETRKTSDDDLKIMTFGTMTESPTTRDSMRVVMANKLGSDDLRDQHLADFITTNEDKLKQCPGYLENINFLHEKNTDNKPGL